MDPRTGGKMKCPKCGHEFLFPDVEVFELSRILDSKKERIAFFSTMEKALNFRKLCQQEEAGKDYFYIIATHTLDPP